MKLLLDTHVWVWTMSARRRLPRRVDSLLSKNSSELWVSPLNTWEVLVMIAKGRLNPKVPTSEWMRNSWEQLNLREAPLTHEVTLATREISLPHADPVDTLLAATAKVYNLTLVTADESLARGKGFAILPWR